MKHTVALFALGLSACFQPADDSGKNGLPGPGGAGGTGGSTGAGGGFGSMDVPDGATCTSVSLVDPGSSVQPAGACICTRRDVVPVGNCPRGQNETASAVIGPKGGSITLKGQQGPATGTEFVITFPPNAIATDTLITVVETRIPPPVGVVDWSPVYRIAPDGLVLAEAAKLKIPASQGRGSSRADDKLAVFWSGSGPGGDCALERLPTSYVNAGFMQASVGRLGYAMVGYAQQGGAAYCQ